MSDREQNNGNYTKTAVIATKRERRNRTASTTADM